MKRSEINKAMREAVEFAQRMNFKLPPFAFFKPEEWADKGGEYDEIRDNYLGWDITDFGSGDFEKMGLLMFTIRNGSSLKPQYYKTYSEKLLIVGEGQITPRHMHWERIEDIINRGGGNLCVELYNCTSDGKLLDTDVRVSKDGRNYMAPAGTVVKLTPGESISLPTVQYHKFWGEPGKGKVLAVEVANVSRKLNDNLFFDNLPRFPEIIEDEKPLYLMFKDLLGL
jgi:D-lyxose ketol-isomerase